MRGSVTRIRKFVPKTSFSREFRTGISLHSHTMHSKEHLGRFPAYVAKIPLANAVMEREVGKAHLYKGRVFDFKRFYWTPPLSPREAHELESQQITSQLELHSIISLSDHDSIEAGLHLRLLPGSAHAPISVEWTVPFERTTFHIGVHNLPASEATDWMAQFRAFTANPMPELLQGLLTELTARREVLIILNHPYWDAENIGQVEHRECLKSFYRQYGNLMHALELNGMRSRRENREVVRLGEEVGLPVISGGDRHGCEPNGVLNVTKATNFGEFVAEIHQERKSEIMLMPQYFEPLQLRLLENAWHALADAPGEFGRTNWMTRVFVIDDSDGTEKAVSNLGARPFVQKIERFRWVISLMASPALRPALRLPFLWNEEGGL